LFPFSSFCIPDYREGSFGVRGGGLKRGRIRVKEVGGGGDV